MTPLQFIQTAVRDYRVGALTRSTSYVADEIIRALPAHAKYIVEYGPGDGVVTREVLQRLPKDGRLVIIERNAQFIGELKRIGDPRLTVVHGDVVEHSRALWSLGMPRVDAVFSGIPCTFFTPPVRESIVRGTHAALASNGSFIVYQYTTLMRPVLRKYFPKVTTRLEPINLPPYFVMRADK